MNLINRLYTPSLSLLTDLYQLTMAYGYWKENMAEKEAVFHLTFRNNPFGGGFALMCGTALAVDFIEDMRFDEKDISYLGTLPGNDGKPLFDKGFLDYLSEMKFSIDLDGMVEGTAVFAHEPLLRVTGPLIQCQLLETALLNIINFQTLIATKAARVALAAKSDPVLEFGLRRAQGIDGGLSASRAAFIGGCAATSNVLAGRLFDIPVKGTHAHSWVMCFETEPESFTAYAEAMPNNCIFLVDTYNTLQGVKNAVIAGNALREKGHEMVGIRLDSGNLEKLSKQARRILDEGGFPKAAIVASSDLDEHLIEELKTGGAPIGIWGVGTKLATAFDQPALGGVYKLGGIREENGDWNFKIKLSEEPIKVTNPGLLQVRRFVQDGQFAGDVIYNEADQNSDIRKAYDLVDQNRRWECPSDARQIDLLIPLMRKGRRVWEGIAAKDARAFAQNQLAALPGDVKKLTAPTVYPVGLERNLHEMKGRLMSLAKDHLFSKKQ